MIIRRSLAWAMARGQVVERYKLYDTYPGELPEAELEFIDGTTNNLADYIQGVKPRDETAH